MAIEQVHVFNNTSVIQDEVLAHRLGLIPLKANPNKFKFKTNRKCIHLYSFKSAQKLYFIQITFIKVEEEGTDEDTLEYELKIRCKLPKDAAKDDKKSYIDSTVLSSHIVWTPIGNQAETVGSINVVIYEMFEYLFLRFS